METSTVCYDWLNLGSQADNQRMHSNENAKEIKHILFSLKDLLEEGSHWYLFENSYQEFRFHDTMLL